MNIVFISLGTPGMTKTRQSPTVASMPAAVPAVLKIIFCARDHRLDAVGRGHRAAAPRQRTFLAPRAMRIFFQRRVQDLGQRLAGQVVFGGAQAAGNQQHLASRRRLANRLLDGPLIVGDGRVLRPTAQPTDANC